MKDRVPAAGPRTAKIAIVGEAPGKEEMRHGRPFIGASGKFLRDIMRSVGMDKEACYQTNVMKTRPDDFGNLYKDSKKREPGEELKEARDSLLEELKGIKPNLVIALGSEALKALTSHWSIEKWRGSIIYGGHINHRFKVLPMLHPAHILRGQYHKWAVMQIDMKKARHEQEFPEVRTPEVNIETSPSFERVIDFLNSKPEKVAYDVETIGSYIRCLGMADSRDHAIVIPFTKSLNVQESSTGGTFVSFSENPGFAHYWSEEEERHLLYRLKEFFEDSSIGKIAQNHPFDSSLMETNFGISVQGLWMDTMIAWHVCYPELEKSLDFLTSVCTPFPRYSDYSPENDFSTWNYNGMDCIATFWSAENIAEELREFDQWDFYKTHMEPTMLAATRTQNIGVPADEAELSKARQGAEGELEEARQKAQEEVSRIIGHVEGQEDLNEDFNPNSHEQCKRLLYGVLRLAPQKDPKTGNPTSGEDALKIVRRKHPFVSDLIDQILKYRQRQTLISTFASVKLTEDRRIKTSYNVAGAATGRLSSSKTPAGYGMNLQNLPRNSFRRCVAADKEHYIIKADLEQAEFRIVAWAARIRRLIDRFLQEEAFDIHSFNASQVFDVPEERVKEPANERGDSYRDLAKNGVYGSNYAMGAMKASKVYDIPFKDAKYVIEKYHEITPEVSSVFWREIEQQLKSNRTITNPMGRKRVFLGRLNDNDTFRQAYSHFPQSTVGDVVNRAWRVLDQILPGLSWVALQVHDELDIMCHKNLIHDVVPLIRSALEYPLYFEGVEEPLVIPTEVKVGKNWWDVEPYDPNAEYAGRLIG